VKELGCLPQPGHRLRGPALVLLDLEHEHVGASAADARSAIGIISRLQCPLTAGFGRQQGNGLEKVSVGYFAEDPELRS
jgi:hypothetical protein